MFVLYGVLWALFFWLIFPPILVLIWSVVDAAIFKPTA